MSGAPAPLPRQSRLVLWIFSLLITLIHSALALPTNGNSHGSIRRTRLGSRDNSDNGLMGADPGTDSSGSDTGGDTGSGTDTSASGSMSGSGSMSTLSTEPVTVQLGAGFIIGCVLGVVGYAIVKLTMKTVRGGLSMTAERRGRWRGREEEEQPDLMEV